MFGVFLCRDQIGSTELNCLHGLLRTGRRRSEACLVLSFFLSISKQKSAACWLSHSYFRERLSVWAVKYCLSLSVALAVMCWDSSLIAHSLPLYTHFLGCHASPAVVYGLKLCVTHHIQSLVNYNLYVMKLTTDYQFRCYFYF